MSMANRESDLCIFFIVPMARELRSPLASSAPVLPLEGLTWTAMMTNIIPHALNLETLFPPVLSFYFFLPK
jgi:hypothetical protein